MGVLEDAHFVRKVVRSGPKALYRHGPYRALCRHLESALLEY
jgi:hypothetical protein